MTSQVYTLMYANMESFPIGHPKKILSPETTDIN